MSLLLLTYGCNWISVTTFESYDTRNKDYDNMFVKDTIFSRENVYVGGGSSRSM